MLAAIDVIIEEGAKAFIAGLGVPGPVIQRCHDAGLLVMSMCGKVSHAVAAEEAGCDVVVAQGTEAGGHTGQIGGIALIPQIVDAVDIPVLAAGAIVDGRGLAAALAFGAQGVWMGTRFIASHEARANEGYKKRITEIGVRRNRDHALLLGQADARGAQCAGSTTGSAGRTRSSASRSRCRCRRAKACCCSPRPSPMSFDRAAPACRAARAPAAINDIPTCAEIISG